MNSGENGLHATDTVLDVRNLSVEIEVPAGILHAVSGIDFHVARGETLCIVGESGCGKSIASLAVMNLLPRKARMRADRLYLESTDLMTIGEKKFAALRGDRIGMIFQDPMTSLNPVYQVGDQMVEVFIRHGKGTRKEGKERAEYLLDKVGITGAHGRLKQYPHQLSGGLRQRIMIAMTLMCDPTLIIADEPTTALDVTIQAQILQLLASLQDEFNMGMILITHDLGVVARTADKVAVMYAGKFVETGTAMEVFADPVHPYTQGLLSCIPIPGQSEPGSRLGSIKGMVPSMIGDLDGCLFKNRCDYVREGCVTGAIEFEQLSEGRGFRCFLSRQDCHRNYQASGLKVGALEVGAPRAIAR